MSEILCVIRPRSHDRFRRFLVRSFTRMHGLLVFELFPKWK
nr:MAG TPA: hypothetical protein [Caudoviricetes sp.]